MRRATIEIEARPEDERAVPRYGNGAAGTVRSQSRLPIDVRLIDISTDGVGFEAEVHLEMGTRISIGVAGLPARSATVTRSQGRFHGCAFDIPISPRDVQHAGTPNTVPFPVGTFEVPLPHVEPLPRRTRLAIIAGGAIAAWSLVAALVSAV